MGAVSYAGASNIPGKAGERELPSPSNMQISPIAFLPRYWQRVSPARHRCRIKSRRHPIAQRGCLEPRYANGRRWQERDVEEPPRR